MTYRITSNNRGLFKTLAERRALIRRKAGKMEDCATNCNLFKLNPFETEKLKQTPQHYPRINAMSIFGVLNKSFIY